MTTEFRQMCRVCRGGGRDVDDSRRSCRGCDGVGTILSTHTPLTGLNKLAGALATGVLLIIILITSLTFFNALDNHSTDAEVQTNMIAACASSTDVVGCLNALNNAP